MVEVSKAVKVFYCGNSHEPEAAVVERGPVVCKKCGKNMKEIGWYQKNEQ